MPRSAAAATRSTAAIALRLRLPVVISAAIGLIAVMAAVGALFPAVGHSIGTLHVPRSVVNLLGGADYGTITGWFRSEIGVTYGPLAIATIAITSATATTAGEEEDGILALVLAHPIERSRLLLAKSGAIAAIVAVIACATWVGLTVGVALGGGGITTGHVTALCVQLALFGLATGAPAIAVAAATGRRSLAGGVATAIAVLGWLINSFAPLVSGLGWLKYLSLFYYYAGRDPLTRGLDLGGALVLCGVTAALMTIATRSFARRDLRG
jgi:ABC-2 type transport system permease protein